MSCVLLSLIVNAATFHYDCRVDVCDSLTRDQKTFCNTYQRITNKNCIASKQSHTSE